MSDKPAILLSAKELLARGIKPFNSLEELEKADWNDDETFNRGYVTQYLSAIGELQEEFNRQMTEEFEKRDSKSNEKWQDWLHKADEVTRLANTEINNAGRAYLESTDPKVRAEGLFLLCSKQISKLFNELGSTQGKNYRVDKLAEITMEAEEVIKQAGAWDIPLGRGMISPASISTRANLTTTAAGGGYLIDSVFIPRIIEELYEEFGLMGSFTNVNVAAGTAVVPRISAGSTAYRRNEASAGTATGITFSQLSVTCTPISAFTVVTKEMFQTAEPSLQVQSLILLRLARAMAYKYKNEFINGTGSSQFTGLETENTSGYLNTFPLAADRVASIMGGLKLLGGSKNVGWQTQAIVVANKNAVWTVAEEVYNDGRYKLDLAQPIGSLVIRGVRFEMIETVPDDVYYIMVPREYDIFRVPQLSSLTIDDVGYTHQTTNTITFMYNEHSDGKLDANGLGASYKDRYAAVRVAY